MLELLIVAARALALALLGHRGIGFGEPGASAAAGGDDTHHEPPHASARATDCFGSPWPESGGTGARRWCSWSPTPSFDGIAIGSAADGPNVRDPAGRPSTHRSTDPRARPRDGNGEPAVGSTPSSWRAPHSRCRRLGTHGVASAGT